MKPCKKLLVFLVVISFLSISKLSAMSSSSSSSSLDDADEIVKPANACALWHRQHSSDSRKRKRVIEKPKQNKKKKINPVVITRKKTIKRLILHNPTQLAPFLQKNKGPVAHLRVEYNQTLYALALKRSNQAWRVQQQLKKKILDEKQTKKTQCYICLEKTSKKKSDNLDVSPCCNQIGCKQCIIDYKKSMAPNKNACPLCNDKYRWVTTEY